jgi:hypothetical protein
MAREPSPTPTPGNPAVLFIVLVVVLLAGWWVLQSASTIEEFALPTFRGRPVLDRLYGALFGSFWIYAGFRLLRPDVALNWAEHSLDQDKLWAKLTKNPVSRSSIEERLPNWRRWAKFFALMAFVVGACALVGEAVSLFVG